MTPEENRKLVRNIAEMISSKILSVDSEENGHNIADRQEIVDILNANRVNDLYLLPPPDHESEILIRYEKYRRTVNDAYADDNQIKFWVDTYLNDRP